MISLNKAMLVGNLTRDPELRYTPSGRSVCSFGLATNRRWKDPEGNLKEETQFHEIVAWGRLAEIVCQILKKGHKAYVDGRLQTRTWEGQDGTRRQRTEIILENFIPLTPKGLPVEIEELAEVPTEPEPPIEEMESPQEVTEKAKKPKKEEKEAEIDIDEIPF